jgi:hypothetical protein
LSTPGNCRQNPRHGSGRSRAFGRTSVRRRSCRILSSPLILDLLEWVGRAPRPYAEVMEAWRTSCPRLPVWEEANARGFIEQRHVEGGPAVVTVSPDGRRHLARAGREGPRRGA